VADFDVEIDTTISDHIVGASKCQNISDDKAEGKVRKSGRPRDRSISESRRMMGHREKNTFRVTECNVYFKEQINTEQIHLFPIQFLDIF
jgi:hypothetical protein